jgi:hypothetical protein
LKEEKSALLQMMIIPHILIIGEEFKSLLTSLMDIYNYEPGLVASNTAISNNKLYMINEMGIPKNKELYVIDNFLGKNENIDNIGQIMTETYGIPYSDKWEKLLGSEYEYANKLLFTACNAYIIDGNAWINYKDTFNEMLIRRFIPLLRSTHPNIKWPSLNSKNGSRLNFGTILDDKTQLFKKYHGIIKPIKELHLRRNITPTSHAYVNKSNKPSTFVSSSEKKEHFKNLKKSYNLLIKEI